MRKVRYLDRTRDGTYRLRRLVPPDLRNILQQTEISISLGTKDHREAERRIRKVADEVDETFDKARKGLLINYDLRDAMDVIHEWLNNEIENWWDGGAAWKSPPFYADEHAISSITAYIEKWKISLTPRVKAYAIEYAAREYFRYRSRKSMEIVSQAELAEWGHERRDQYLQKVEETRFGYDAPIYPPALLKPADIPTVTLPQSTMADPRLSSITMKAALDEFLSNSNMSISSRNEWALSWRRLIEFTGNIRLSDLQPDHIREWHRLYRRCPKRLPNQIRKKSLREIVEYAERSMGEYDKVMLRSNLNALLR